MQRLNPKVAYLGCPVRTGWSSHVVVVQVLYTLWKPELIFHGVRVENLDGDFRNWPYTEGLLWVLEDGQELRIWQECRQRPRIIDGEADCEIEEIVGHYQAQSGPVYYAIKWVGYECPTWELEDDLHGYSQLLTQYCRHLPTRF
ncbi:hypothetical protein QBC46DRAFT_368726 [Diplogelasinospora grovesii]|uniref:Chromo domain-containing protein n=1 Tax=Diplogelasinospora grovesii TaxID=303347 RepID=A0AAN6MX02_9PEZI|nr:hypothetical protein QBC46DRAFT_368726 [Diplogelasinospora grovesii]